MALPINFKGSNKVWRGWDNKETGETEVLDLNVRNLKLEGDVIVNTSCWKLSRWERFKAMWSGHIWLHVFGDSSHPVVMIEAGVPFYASEQEADKGDDGADKAQV